MPAKADEVPVATYARTEGRQTRLLHVQPEKDNTVRVSVEVLEQLLVDAGYQKVTTEG